MKRHRKPTCDTARLRQYGHRWAICLVVLALSFLVGARAEEAPRRVLVLYSFGREFAPFSIMAGSFRTELAARSQSPIEFYEAVLEAAGLAQPSNEEPLLDYLHARFSNRPLDLVVALGGPAALFVNRHRERLFSDIPMIATMDRRRIKEAGASTNMTVVPLEVNLAGIIEDILQLLPSTTNIVVALGTTPFERYWTAECQHEFAAFTNRVHFTYLNGLSLSGMSETVRALPRDSAILYGTVIMDAAGIPHEGETPLRALHASANAPLFSVYEHQVGLGIVGGRLISSEAWGRRVADTALRILDRQPIDEIKPPSTRPGMPVYDWRELQRWGIGSDRLPPDAKIRFRQLTLWEQHKWVILGVISLCLLQAVLIARLILELRRRRRAENAARESELAAHEASGRLIYTQEAERSRIARDLHDDFNQRLALLSVEIDLLGRKVGEADPATKLKQLGEQTRELASDVHRLAYRLHPAKLEQLGLLPALDGLCRDLSQQSGLKVHLSHHDVPGDLPPDAARCIYHVAQECLHNSVRHSGTNEAHVQLTAQDGHIRLVVSDAGKGFDVAATRKAAGLGLLSMRERVRLSRGRLEIHSAPGRGTRVELTIPWTKEGMAA